MYIIDKYIICKTCIHSVAEEALGHQKKSGKQRKPYWWDDEIEYEIEEKQKKIPQIFKLKKHRRQTEI